MSETDICSDFPKGLGDAVLVVSGCEVVTSGTATALRPNLALRPSTREQWAPTMARSKPRHEPSTVAAHRYRIEAAK